jgi:hypothetical protein
MSDDKPKLGKIDPILSNRFGGPQGGAFLPPGGLPSDPYFLELAEARAAKIWGRWRTAALVALVSLACVTALFIGATLRRYELESQLEARRAPCDRLRIVLPGVKSTITRGNPTSMEILQRASAASLVLAHVIGACVGTDESVNAQRLSEAPDAAAATAVIDEWIARLR